jgi:hypothetical protein
VCVCVLVGSKVINSNRVARRNIRNFRLCVGVSVGVGVSSVAGSVWVSVFVVGADEVPTFGKVNNVLCCTTYLLVIYYYMETRLLIKYS